MVSEKNNIILVNPAATKYVDVHANGDGYDNFINIVRAEKSLDVANLIREAILKKQDVTIADLKMNERFLDISLTPVYNFGIGETEAGCAILINNITKRKEVDMMKSEFVSVASHQLRTPLTAIRLFTEMLKNGDVGALNHDQTEYVDNVYQSTERMVGLVNDLLNITRIESGKLQVNPERVVLDDFILSVIKEIKPIAEMRKIKIQAKNKTGKKLVVGLDKGLFRQVVHNLIVNAVRYSSDNDSVSVEIEVVGNNFEIRIKDQGIGIPKEVQSRIFEKFYRADNAVRVVTEGTGLGLYLAKMIIESSAGKIWFKSVVDKGTTFFIKMPLRGMKKLESDRGLMIS
jgi:signal transduction histidine kinase